MEKPAGLHAYIDRNRSKEHLEQNIENKNHEKPVKELGFNREKDRLPLGG